MVVEALVEDEVNMIHSPQKSRTRTTLWYKWTKALINADLLSRSNPLWKRTTFGKMRCENSYQKRLDRRMTGNDTSCSHERVPSWNGQQHLDQHV